MTDSLISKFLIEHQLPDEYVQNIDNWFAGVAEKVVIEQQQANAPLILGVNGAQGSGKSTLSDLLERLFIEKYDLKAVTLSLDDFYFTRKERQSLSDTVHPLLLTRGVPGTHDTGLAIKTISELLKGESEVRIPRFDKGSDDRYAQEFWTVVDGSVDIIIFEGWCLGAEAQKQQALEQPINELEQKHDLAGLWRNYVNEKLRGDYAELFNLIDTWIMLKAPSFDVVYNWRLEQEQKLRASAPDSKNIMTDEQIAHFIKFYQRITESVLQSLPEKVDFLFELNSQREIIKLTQRSEG